MALSHLAVTRTLTTLATDRSKEAAVCRQFYAQTRDEVLRDFPWPFATRIAALALVAEQPTSEWAFAYRVPVTALRVRRLVSTLRDDVIETRVPYRIIGDATGELLYTDWPDAELEWTERVEVVELFPVDFTQSVALLLASYVAPVVTGGDQFKLGERALKLYAWRLEKAQVNAASEVAPDLAPDADLIRARN